MIYSRRELTGKLQAWGVRIFKPPYIYRNIIEYTPTPPRIKD